MNVKAPASLGLGSPNDPAGATWWTNVRDMKALSGQLAYTLQNAPRNQRVEQSLELLTRDVGQTLSSYDELRRPPVEEPVRLSESSIRELAKQVQEVSEPISRAIDGAGNVIDFYKAWTKSMTQDVSPALQKLVPALSKLAKITGAYSAGRNIGIVSSYVGSALTNPRPMTQTEARATLDLITTAVSATAGNSLPVRGVLAADWILSNFPEYENAKTSFIQGASDLLVNGPQVNPDDIQLGDGPMSLNRMRFNVEINHAPVAEGEIPREVPIGETLKFGAGKLFNDPDRDRLRYRITEEPALGELKFVKNKKTGARRLAYYLSPQKIENAPTKIIRVPGQPQQFVSDFFTIEAIDSSSADGEKLVTSRTVSVKGTFEDGQLEEPRFRVAPASLGDEEVFDAEPAAESVNLSPQIVQPGNLTTNGPKTIPLSVADDTTPIDQLVLFARSSDQSIVPEQSLEIRRRTDWTENFELQITPGTKSGSTTRW